MSKIKYKTVTATETDILDSKVEAMLNNGWQLHGIPFVMIRDYVGLQTTTRMSIMCQTLIHVSVVTDEGIIEPS